MGISSEFLQEEQSHYDGSGIDRLRAAMGNVLRLERYLEIILSRYSFAEGNFRNSLRQLNEAMKEHPIPMEEQSKAFEQQSYWLTLLNLEVESFYLFAKMELDACAAVMH